MSNAPPSIGPGASDKALVDFLERHLANPCQAIVNGVQVNNIHDWVQQAERELPTIADPIEKGRLESAIRIAKTLHNIP